MFYVFLVFYLAKITIFHKMMAFLCYFIKDKSLKIEMSRCGGSFLL